MSDTPEQKNGVLLQGDDGAMYFVPDDRLEEFRVSEAMSSKVRKQLEELSSDEVSGFNFDYKRTYELAPNVRQLHAFSGPLGRVGPDIGDVSDESPTLIY